MNEADPKVPSSSSSDSPSQNIPPTTEHVLSGHLYTAISEIKLETCDLDLIVTSLMDSHSTRELFELLGDKKLLADKVNALNLAQSASNALPTSTSSRLQPRDWKIGYHHTDTGEVLFKKVSEIESELCAQITGMLLELDSHTLSTLLSDSSKLEEAIYRSKAEYLRVHHPQSLPSRDEIGEELYDQVATKYPQHASRITGMLLELDVYRLTQLLDSPDQLKSNMEKALQAIQQEDKH